MHASKINDDTKFCTSDSTRHILQKADEAIYRDTGIKLDKEVATYPSIVKSMGQRHRAMFLYVRTVSSLSKQYSVLDFSNTNVMLDGDVMKKDGHFAPIR